MPNKKVYISDNGNPATGLTLTWEYLLKVSDGIAFTPQPTFTEIGGGWYKFDIAVSEDVVGVIDASASIAIDSERYVPIYVSKHDFLYDVLVMPVYDEDTDSLKFFVFMLENGQVVSTATACTITVYDSAHVEQFSVNSSSITNGVFVLSKSTPGLVKNSGYYCVAVITYGGVTYTSLDTYISIE